jgi:hypothetical protein
VSLADLASESATSPVEIAFATESEIQSMQPVPELDVAWASPCRTPTPSASAFDVTSPVSDALLDVALDTELMPPADIEKLPLCARPSLVSALDATVLCACTTVEHG